MRLPSRDGGQGGLGGPRRRAPRRHGCWTCPLLGDTQARGGRKKGQAQPAGQVQRRLLSPPVQRGWLQRASLLIPAHSFISQPSTAHPLSGNCVRGVAPWGWSSQVLAPLVPLTAGAVGSTERRKSAKRGRCKEGDVKRVTGERGLLQVVWSRGIPRMAAEEGAWLAEVSGGNATASRGREKWAPQALPGSVTLTPRATGSL